MKRIRLTLLSLLSIFTLFTVGSVIKKNIETVEYNQQLEAQEASSESPSSETQFLYETAETDTEYANNYAVNGDYTLQYADYVNWPSIRVYVTVTNCEDHAGQSLQVKHNSTVLTTYTIASDCSGTKTFSGRYTNFTFNASVTNYLTLVDATTQEIIIAPLALYSSASNQIVGTDTVTSTPATTGQNNGTITYTIQWNDNANIYYFDYYFYLFNATSGQVVQGNVNMGSNSGNYDPETKTSTWTKTGLGAGTYYIGASTYSDHGNATTPLKSNSIYVQVGTQDTNAPTGASISVSAIENTTVAGNDGSFKVTGDITHSGTSSSGDAVIQTTINNGTTWQTLDSVNGYTYTNLVATNYTVKARIRYTNDASTYSYINLASKTVTISSGTYAEPVPTISWRSTAATTPSATDGTISGTISSYTNNNNNIVRTEISKTGTDGWTSINTGLTGYAAGTHTVYYRVYYYNGVDPDPVYGTTRTASVNVASNNFSQVVTPVVTITPGANPNEDYTAELDFAFSNQALASTTTVKYSWDLTASQSDNSYTTWDGVTPVPSRDFASGSTSYVDVQYSYDANGNGTLESNETDIQANQYIVTAYSNPWEKPEYSITTSHASQGSVESSENITITQLSGDHDALLSMSLDLTDTNGVSVWTDTITLAEMADGTETVTTPLITNGAYTLELEYTYDLGDGAGVQTHTFDRTILLDATAPQMTYDNVATTPHSTEGTNNGSLSLHYTIQDPSGVLSNINASIWRLNASGNYVKVSEQSISTGADIDDSLTFSNLQHGEYKLVFTYDVLIGEGGVSRIDDPLFEFTIDKTFTEQVVLESHTSSTTYYYDSVNDIEYTKISLDYSYRNLDNQDFDIRIEIKDKTNDTVVASEDITQADVLGGTIEFLVPIGGSYEMVITDVNNNVYDLTTETVQLTTQDAQKSAPTVADSVVTKTTNGTTSAIKYELTVNNPDNRKYKFTVTLHDNTNNVDLASYVIDSSTVSTYSTTQTWTVEWNNLAFNSNYTLVISDVGFSPLDNFNWDQTTFYVNADGSITDTVTGGTGDIVNGSAEEAWQRHIGLIVASTLMGLILAIVIGLYARLMYKEHKKTKNPTTTNT